MLWGWIVAAALKRRYGEILKPLPEDDQPDCSECDGQGGWAAPGDWDSRNAYRCRACNGSGIEGGDDE